MKGLLLYTLLLATSLLDYAKVTVTAQQFNEPEGQRRDQTYRVVEFENSGIDQSYDGYLSYDCTFRGKWSQARHPREFPTRASWSMPVMVSHSNAWRFWTGTEAVRTGAESVAEVRLKREKDKSSSSSSKKLVGLTHCSRLQTSFYFCRKDLLPN